MKKILAFFVILTMTAVLFIGASAALINDKTNANDNGADQSVIAAGDDAAAEKDPDTWLCKAGGPVNTGWWMKPFTDREWVADFTFTTPNSFDGFAATFFANPDPGAKVVISVLDDSGNTLDFVEHTQKGDGLVSISFNRAFAPGTYTIRFGSTDSGAHFVIGSSEAGDIEVTYNGNCDTNENTLTAPIILLTGAVNPDKDSSQPVEGDDKPEDGTKPDDTQKTDDTPKTADNPKTADASVIVTAIAAVTALAGAAVVKKIKYVVF